MRSAVAQRPAHARSVAAALVLLAGLAALGAFVPPETAQAAPVSSAVTLSAADYYKNAWHSDGERAAAAEGTPFPDLKVTISQTTDLTLQGIMLTYEGGRRSVAPQGSVVGGEDFLQVAQCWGDDPTSNGTRPDRRTCQYGGTNGGAALRDGYRETDTILSQDDPYSADVGGYSYTNTPFVAYNDLLQVDETKAPADKVIINTKKGASGQVVMKTGSEAVQLFNNKFFNPYTTNELKWAPFSADGTGSAPFELQTAQQSPGLGCGTPLTQPDGSLVGQSCWLVIIPRGAQDNGTTHITTPGVWWDSWRHHIAVKLQFKPLGVRCQLGATERQLSGSELVAEAIGSWQPVVCQDASPFVLAQVPETDAVTAAAGTDPSALALTSRPLDLATVPDESDPLVYAPVALAGVTVSFAVDAAPAQSAPAEYQARSGLPLPTMNLTPRLLAKLLTASYRNAIPIGADARHLGYKSAADQGHNPVSIVLDKDFQQYNDPEWAAQNLTGIAVSDAMEPLGRSDLAERVWEYIVADPEARAWLDGTPDPWGMVVNPCYSTSADVSARCPAADPDDTEAPPTPPLDLPRDDFPKADPSFKPDNTKEQPVNGVGEVNLVTARPYTTNFADGAYRVLRGDGMILGGWTWPVVDNKGNLLSPGKFSKQDRQLLGSREVIALSSSPAAEVYQTATARLRNPSGAFVAPDTAGLLAAAAAMTPTEEQSQVLWFDPSSGSAAKATGAYPLAVPVYAALNPAQDDADLRGSYATLIRYAATDGQRSGTDVGQLPAGYAPIPESWRTQALAAADTIAKGGTIDPTPTPTPTESSTPTPTPTPTPGSSSTPTPKPTPTPTPSQSSPAPSAAPPPTPPPSAPADGGGGDPAPSGGSAGPLTGAATPADPAIGGLGAVVPVTGLLGVAAVLGVPAISRLRRSL